MWRGKLFSKANIFSNKDFHMLFTLSESIIIKNVKAFLSANDGRQVNTTSSLFVCIFKPFNILVEIIKNRYDKINI